MRYYGIISLKKSAVRAMHTSSSSIRSLPYLGWKVGQAKNVFGRVARLQTETSPGRRRGISLDSLPYPTRPNVTEHGGDAAATVGATGVQ